MEDEEIEGNVGPSVFACPFCKETFLKKPSLNKHIERKHPSERNIRKPRICPLCKSSGNKQYLLKHFTEFHKVDIETEHLTFSTFAEVEKWIEHVQQETKTQFARRTSNLSSVPGKVIQYFECSRTGMYHPKNKRIKRTKVQGTKKINGFCPAEIICTKNINDWSVKFVKTHIGHLNEICHLTLTSSERKSIAGKIASGIPFTNILEQVQSNVVKSECLERLHLLNVKDLHNIRREYKLGSNIVHHLDLDPWIHVQEIEQTGTSYVVMYKPCGTILENHPQLKEQDFVLGLMNSAQTETLLKFGSDYICIDKVYGMNTYGYTLITVLVVDDLHHSFPCAFFISNRVDQYALESFFSSIRERVGKLSPKVFMSDISDKYFKAWVAVMDTPKPPYRLFSNWNVDQAWRCNLHKISNKAMQRKVYDELRVLLEEKDIAAFDVLKESMEKKLLSDSVTAAFGKYVSESFFNCVECWAYSYKLRCGLDVNLQMEQIHKTLKYIYLNGKNGKRLDKCIYALIRLVRDKVLDRLLFLDEEKITSKLKDIRKRHCTSEENEIVEDVIDTSDGWLVNSSQGGKLYYVYRIAEKCQCQLVCTQCNACLHLYTCSCPDSSLNWHMCKHIHAVCSFQSQFGNQSSSVVHDECGDVDTVMEVDDSSEETPSNLNHQLQTTTETDNLKHHYLEVFNTKLNSLSPEEMPLVDEMLHLFEVKLEAMRGSLNSTLPGTSGVPTFRDAPQKETNRCVEVGNQIESEIAEGLTLEGSSDSGEVVISIDDLLTLVHRPGSS